MGLLHVSLVASRLCPKTSHVVRLMSTRPLCLCTWTGELSARVSRRRVLCGDPVQNVHHWLDGGERRRIVTGTDCRGPNVAHARRSPTRRVALHDPVMPV